MSRPLTLFVLFLGFFISPIGLGDDKPGALVGTWAYKPTSGQEQYWVITNTGGKWVVKGWYQKDGLETGSFVGNDVTYADGVLTYTHKYVKKPEAGQDNAPVKITAAGNTLAYRWGKDYAKGPRTLTRQTGTKESASTPTDAAKTTGKKKLPFVGSWRGSSDGHNQIWTIANEDGVWAVRVAYQRNGVEIGSAVGSEIKHADNTLTFKRKFVKKPGSDWKEDAVIVMKVDGVNLLYSFSGSTPSRPLEPLKEAPAAANEAAKNTAKFLGTWEGQVEQFRTLWDIRQKDDKWQVAVEYFSKNAKTGAFTLVGSYVGVDTEIRDGNLVFDTKFLKKPTAGWAGGKITCKLLGEDSFEYVLDTGGAKKKPLLVTRIKK